MPHSSADNPTSDTPTTGLIPAETAAPVSDTPKWDKVEQERLTRRAALRKMGYTSGIALFSMFAVDDLARMAIKKMEQHKETRQIAETVAKEFKNSGIAFANSTSNYTPTCCTSNLDCSCCGGTAATCDCCSGSSDPTGCCKKAYGGLNGNLASCQQCCDQSWPS